MRRVLAAVVLATVVTAPLRAQDDHHGPVVYPASSNAPAADGLAPDTNTEAAPQSPASASQNAASAPDALTSGTPGSVPAGGVSVTPGIISPNGLNPAGANPLSALNPAGANGKPDDIYDIRPPFFYLKPLTWLWVLLGLLAAIALGLVLWFLLKPQRVMRAKTAYELALERLEKARALLNEENPEPYAVFVSETVRNYLGQRFHAPSTRRTTEEFLRQMQADANTPLAAHRDLLRSFLEACDLVKFAHYQPGRDELEKVQERAVSFVTATRPVEGVPA